MPKASKASKATPGPEVTGRHFQGVTAFIHNSVRQQHEVRQLLREGGGNVACNSNTSTVVICAETDSMQRLLNKGRGGRALAWVSDEWVYECARKRCLVSKERYSTRGSIAGAFGVATRGPRESAHRIPSLYEPSTSAGSGVKGDVADAAGKAIAADDSQADDDDMLLMDEIEAQYAAGKL
ncbi:hypothetical protein EXIGLDRAFT_758600 [Exidia glandulosa HHB12029]|uniref:BRCT domain-containing protein n=1 Tax=Exidia glandulosa HHB12029 TaxID=1314781 RepID=A0A165R077_EXIGL|nr:hypothetical protein EXIGLDRAFT_758600 [Exidia glandulosa HHB12029]